MTSRKLDRWDFLCASALFLSYTVLLLCTVKDLGYARDEGFYFQAARSYEAWFELLQLDPSRALQPEVVDRYWSANHEHPALMKSLFALSHRYLFSSWHWFNEQGTAYRFPAMVVSALGVAFTYAWGARVSGRWAGLVAAASFALMPHVFHHAHLACFDMPVTALLLITSYAFARSLTGNWPWALATGVLYGLLLETKHNAWLLPGAFVLHFALIRAHLALSQPDAKPFKLPLAFPALLVISPLVFYACWPWIWHDTLPRLRDYANFHLQHEYYNMEFLGRTYWKPPMPRLYAWVMTLATVPSVTLILFGIGVWVPVGRWVEGRLRRGETKRKGRERSGTGTGEEESADLVLWAVCLVMCYAPWGSSDTPIFGGTKHWMTAYPFLCLFAGRGFAVAAERIAELLQREQVRRAVLPALAFSVLIGPVCMALHSTPWGLSFYTPLVGGEPGAASLGLNRGFWGYSTGALQGFINQAAPPRGNVYVHDTALQSWEMMMADGRLRSDLRGSMSIAGSSLALYHHEQHMRRVEYETWLDYGHAAPAQIGTFDGVPIVWVYAR